MDEVLFQGRMPLVLDAKHRLTVPARYRSQLQAISGDALTLVRHHTDPCLVLYPRAHWQATARQLMALPMEVEDWRREIFSTALDVELDSAARIVVPPEMRTIAGIERDVMMVGNGRRLEVWDAAAFGERSQSTQSSPMPASIRSLTL